MDVSSQILYAEMRWDEMENADSAKKKEKKNRLNNVKHVGEAKLWSMVEIKTQFSSHIHE